MKLPLFNILVSGVVFAVVAFADVAAEKQRELARTHKNVTVEVRQ